MTGKVYLVGAGPGDPGLLTLKGRQVLEASDCVIYDHLVNPVLLDFAPGYAERIYVGKCPERHYVPQQEISQLMIARARAGRVVARLKGGDPFLFGRGGEEAEALAGAGVPWEVIPGVTSALAVPAYAGIPLTHRDLSSSVAIVTAHEQAGREGSRIEWEKLATAVDTLVFLMCFRNLAELTAKLIEYGRPAATPAAFLQWGTYEHQQVKLGTLGDIAERVRRCGLGSPAVLIVGPVVQLAEKLQWFMPNGEFGMRIAESEAFSIPHSALRIPHST